MNTQEIKEDIDIITYKARMKELQNMIAQSITLLEGTNKSLIVVFEGLDAAGKSGCIKRLTKKLSHDQYEVVPISKPTAEEYRHHYLHRFCKALPEYKKAVFFDRSWYGRVLVERIEKFCKDEEWMRAYNEINCFEKMLFDDGAVIIKFWLDVSPEEQLKRFRDRTNDPEKRHKITDEDWRNRSKRDEYDNAAAEMIAKTSSSYAPWTVIPSDSKKIARIKTAEEIVSRLDTII